MAQKKEIDFYTEQNNVIYLKAFFSNYDFQEQFCKLNNVHSFIESYNEQLKKNVRLHADNLIHSIKKKYKKNSKMSSRSKSSKTSSFKSSSTSLATEKKTKPTATVQEYIQEAKEDFIRNSALDYKNHQDFLAVNREIEKILTDCFSEFSGLFPEKNFFESQQLPSVDEKDSDPDSELKKAFSQFSIDEIGENELKHIVYNRNECIDFIQFEKMRLIGKIPLFYKQEIKNNFENELKKIKDVTAQSNDLNVLFSEKLNLDSLVKKIDYFIFGNKKIIFNFDDLRFKLSANRFFSYKKSFDLNNAVEMLRNIGIHGQIAFLKNVPLQGPFVELKHEKISNKLNVSIDHGLNPKSLQINEIEQVISLKTNTSDTILIEAISSSNHQDIVLFIRLNNESGLKLLDMKSNEQVLTVDEDTFEYHFYDDSFVLNKVTFQNYDVKKKFYLNFKNVYSINHFEFRHDKYFFKLNADNGLDGFIFVFDLEGNCIETLLTDGEFKIGSKKLFVHEGEYLKCYCLASLLLLEEIELIRSIEQLKNCPVAHFHADFEDNCILIDNFKVYKI